jgi:hypothetical protein
MATNNLQFFPGYSPLPIVSIFECFQNAFATGQLRQIDVLAWMLGRNPSLQLPEHVSNVLKTATIAGLDMEWYWADISKRITELGICTLQIPPYRQADQLLLALEYMSIHHVRVREYAHMVNWTCQWFSRKVSVRPTTFVRMEEGRSLLSQCFALDNAASGIVQPVVLVGHAVDNDIEVTKAQMGVDLNRNGGIIAILDTQVMAAELEISNAAEKPIGLRSLIEYFAITEPYLHNSGNDIATTMIALLLLVEEFTSPGVHKGNPANQMHVNQLKQTLVQKSRFSPIVGIATFCTKCDSTQHAASECPVIVRCNICANMGLEDKMGTHKTEKCVELIRPPPRKHVRFPCLDCVTHPTRHNFASSHETEDCGFRKLNVESKHPSAEQLRKLFPSENVTIPSVPRIHTPLLDSSESGPKYTTFANGCRNGPSHPPNFILSGPSHPHQPISSDEHHGDIGGFYGTRRTPQAIITTSGHGETIVVFNNGNGNVIFGGGINAKDSDGPTSSAPSA